MRTITVMDFKDFAEIHGKDWVYSEGRYYFRDGASCSEDFDMRWEPPSDSIELARHIRRYLVLKIRDEEFKFTQFQNECRDLAEWAKANRNCKPPSPHAVEQLRRGKARIDKLKAELAEFENERMEDSASTESILQARAVAESERCGEIDNLLAEIEAIQL